VAGYPTVESAMICLAVSTEYRRVTDGHLATVETFARWQHRAMERRTMFAVSVTTCVSTRVNLRVGFGHFTSVSRCEKYGEIMQHDEGGETTEGDRG